MSSAKVFFSKKHNPRNRLINEEVPVVDNGYDVQDSDEDEVFVQDPHLEISASKPLMHPRNKSHRTKVKRRSIECRFCHVFKPIFYFVALVTVLCGVMATIVYIANKHKSISEAILIKQEENNQKIKQVRTKVTGCDKVETSDVWMVGIPKLLTESAFRLVDINSDGILDIIFGFATGTDGYGVKDIVCDIYFDGNNPCHGGVMALEGATGKELWRRYTKHEIYGLNCQSDLNGDGIRDCLSAGRAGTFVAISCKDGSVLWELGKTEAINPIMNFYTPQYISDLNGDKIPDVIIVHGGDPLQEAGSAQRLSGRILLVCGRTGEVITWTGVPDKRESYYSPQILTGQNNVQVLLFGTGGETHNGSLWRIEVESLKKGFIDRAVKLSSDTHKGFMTPPALVDVTNDGVEDIIVPMFNSTLLALDGKTYLPIWSVLFPMSESYSTPAVGYYNDDEVPDFLVKFAHGPGYPLYYYSETTVIDGKTGRRLIDPPLKDTIGSQSSPLTIAMEGIGNDVFIVWMADCQGHEGATEEYSFVKGTKNSDKSRSNLCRIRFKSNGFSKLMVISSTLPKGGVIIYNSDDRKVLEHSKWINTTAEAFDFIRKHPELLNGVDRRHPISDQWNDVNSGAHLPSEGIYSAPEYVSEHRTSSKKGPDIGLSDSNKKKINKQADFSDAAQYFKKGNAAAAKYNPSSSYNLPQVDDYGIPYKDTIGDKVFYNTPFGSYYPSDNQHIYPKHRIPFTSRSATKKSYFGSYSKREVNMINRMKTRGKRQIRQKRHVGPHDDEGIQRLLSTGVLAPTTLSMTHKDYNTTIDVVFATYWFFPTKTQAILPQDQKCISEKLAKEGIIRLDPESPYYQMNHDEYEDTVTAECIKISNNHLRDKDIYSNVDEEYNPFDLNMGQMTVYRLRLKFTCSQKMNNSITNVKCGTVLPYMHQRWAGYMGSNGDSHWLPPFMK